MALQDLLVKGVLLVTGVSLVLMDYLVRRGPKVREGCLGRLEGKDWKVILDAMESLVCLVQGA